MRVRRLFPAVLAVIALTVGLLAGQVSTSGSAAAAGGTVYGHVTPPPEVPADLTGMTVSLWAGGRTYAGSIDGAGDYAITGVPPGGYYDVLFGSKHDYLADTYAPGVLSRREARHILVGAAPVLVDIQVVAGAVVEGTVNGYVKGKEGSYGVNAQLPPDYPDNGFTSGGSVRADGTYRATRVPPGRRSLILRADALGGLVTTPPDPPAAPDAEFVGGHTYQVDFTAPALGVHRFTYDVTVPGASTCSLQFVKGDAPLVPEVFPGDPLLAHGFVSRWATSDYAAIRSVDCWGGNVSILAQPEQVFQAKLVVGAEAPHQQWVGSADNARVTATSLSGAGTHEHTVTIGVDGRIAGPAGPSGSGYVVDADGLVVSYAAQGTAVPPGRYNLFVVTGTQPGAPAPYFYPNRPEDLGVPPASIEVSTGRTITLPKPPAPAVGGVLRGRFYPARALVGWAPAPETEFCLFTPAGTLTTRCGRVDGNGRLAIGGLATGRYLLGMTPSATARATGTKLTSATAYVPVDVVRGRTTDLGAVNAAVRPFTDLPKGSAFQWEIDWFRLRGFTTGYADGSFHPNETVSREAMAAFFYRAAGSSAYAAPVRSPFVDVPRGAPFYKEICWLAAKGISTGWVAANGTRTYRPKQAITREAMAAFLYRASGSPRPWWPSQQFAYWDVKPGMPFEREVTWASLSGILVDLGTTGFYHPTYPMTRALLADFFYNWKAGYAYSGSAR